MFFRASLILSVNVPEPAPQLTLTGKWLEPLGFTNGQKIEVLAAPGQLLVRLAEDT
ncbi:SymE family type I addiction module toxin [Serratia rubidaea]